MQTAFGSLKKLEGHGFILLVLDLWFISMTVCVILQDVLAKMKMSLWIWVC